MFQRFSSLFNRSNRSNSYYRYLLSGFMVFILSITINLLHIQPSHSISWLDLMIRGIQVVQFSNISNAQEVELGSSINQELISSGQAKIYRNQTINSYINQIGQRLAKTSNRSDLSYTFQVVDSNDLNAFATMGGYVYVNRGLIAAADNEAELASVIGHEIGHIAAKHGIKHMRDQAVAQGLLSAAGLDRSDAVQIGVELAVSRPNGRSDELEADRFGLNNMIKAKYAPEGMLGFMQKLLQKGGSTPTFLSTHPATSERIKILKELINPQTANVGDGLDSRAYKSRISSL
ncbi:MAG: hypothetical protein RLZZ04_2039 [Cyanobacteriota bacterium]